MNYLPFRIRVRPLMLATRLLLFLTASTVALAHPEDDVIVHKDITSRPLVTRGADGKLTYKPYTDKRDVIIDFPYAGYNGSEEPIPDIPTMRTLAPLPDTPAPTLNPTPNEQELAYPDGPDRAARIQATLDEIAALEPGPSGQNKTEFAYFGSRRKTQAFFVSPIFLIG